MKYERNEQLKDMINQTIKKSGYSKSHICNELGVTRQALSKVLAKKNITLLDMQKILDIIGYEVHIEVKKKDR